MNAAPLFPFASLRVEPRFAGATIDDAVQAAHRLNDLGIDATISFSCQPAASAQDALAARDEYLRLLEASAAAGVRADITLKLSALGLSIDEGLCSEYLSAVAERAANAETARRLLDPFVRVAMEGSALAERALHVFERTISRTPNVGITLQAALRRTPSDLERTIALGARVSLCKGAYDEPAEIAHRDAPTIRRECLRLAESLLTRGDRPGIATHDRGIVEAVRRFAAERGIARDRFEFAMFSGVRPELQRRLVAAGYRVRAHVAYGTRKDRHAFALRSLFAR